MIHDITDIARREILREMLTKQIQRENGVFATWFLAEIDPDKVGLDVVVDSHDTPTKQPMYTMVRVTIQTDGEPVSLVGFSKRCPTDKIYNHEIGYRRALHRALNSIPQR